MYRRTIFILLAFLQSAIVFAECVNPAGIVQDAAEDGQKRILLSKGTAFLANVVCAPDSTYPPKHLVETEISGWWLIHTPDEDIAPLWQLITDNSELISQTLNGRRLSGVTYWGAWGVNFRAWLEVANKACSLQVELPEGVELRASGIWPHSYGSSDDSCASIAVLTAVNGYRLVKKGEHILVEELTNQ